MAKAAPVAIDEVDVPVDESAPPKSSRLAWALIAVAVLFVLGASGGALWYFMDDTEEPEAEPSNVKASIPRAAAKGKESPADKAHDRKPSVFVNLEAITVNLQGETGERYLQTTIVLELSDEKTAEAVKAQMPVIRSKVLLLLSSKKSTELNVPAGKEKLALEIMDETRKHFTSKPPERALLNVHFNAFVIQ